MITIIDTNVNIEFAKDDIGVIAIDANKNILSLQELLVKNLKVGEVWKNGDENPLPKIELEFYKTDSIDYLIKALLVIKDHLQCQNGDYPLAV